MHLRHTFTCVLVSVVFAACVNPFEAAQDLDTIAAYEQFLAENPNSPYRLQAEIRTEELYLEEARAAKTLESYDVYLNKFPKGKHRATALEERRQHLFGWAEAEGTAEAWNKFLEEYPTGNKKMQQTARTRLRMAESADKIELGPTEIEQVNMAENPDGPLDGWGFWVDVTNKAGEPIEHLMLKISYLDGDGKIIDGREWPVVAKAAPGNIPMPDAFYVPIKPGETRRWEWTSGDMPAGWSKKVKVAPVDIRFSGEDGQE